MLQSYALQKGQKDMLLDGKQVKVYISHFHQNFYIIRSHQTIMPKATRSDMVYEPLAL